MPGGTIYLDIFFDIDIGEMLSIRYQIYKASTLMQAKFYDSRVTSEVSLVRGGAVGARLIHTSSHARSMVGVLQTPPRGV